MIDNDTDEIIDNSFDEFDSMEEAVAYVESCAERSEGIETLKLSNHFDYQDDYGDEPENVRFEIDENNN